METKICHKCGKEMSPGLANLSSSTIVTYYCFNPNCSCEKIDPDKEEQDFKIFFECLSSAYKAFCINQSLHGKIKTGLYQTFEQQWNVILVSLEINYMLWLAKLLDKNDAPDCLKGLVKQEGTDVWKIKKWRDDFLAHFNVLSLREWDRFLGENRLNDESIKVLFRKIMELAEEYNEKTKFLPILKESFAQLEKDTLVECDKWLDNFKNNA